MANLRRAFADSLNGAIAHGLRPDPGHGLGDETSSAIETVACQHPEATAHHIADAYDAFAREHGSSGKPPEGRESVAAESL